MQAKIFDTLDDVKKKAIEGFGILEVDQELLDEQKEKPVNITERCREREIRTTVIREPSENPLANLNWPDPDLSALLGNDPGEAKTEDLDADAAPKVDDRPTCWLHHGCLVKVTGIFRSEDERALLVREAVMKREKRFGKLQKLVELDERVRKASRREPIPDDVRMYVWRRDQGRCVKCGRDENLQFDHIIPVSKGGSSTDRNIQLLCEECNKKKADKI